MSINKILLLIRAYTYHFTAKQLRQKSCWRSVCVILAKFMKKTIFGLWFEYLSVGRSILMFICLSVCKAVWISVFLLVCLFIVVWFVCMYVGLFVCWSICLSISLYTCFSICLSAWLSVSLFVYLSVLQFMFINKLAIKPNALPTQLLLTSPL